MMMGRGMKSNVKKPIDYNTGKGNETEIQGRNETIFNFMLIYSYCYCCSRTNLD